METKNHPIYDERNDEEVFSPCKDNMDGLNDGSVRQKQRQQTNMEKAQDANLLNRRSVTEEEDLPSSSHQSRIQLLEQIAKLEAQLKNNKNQHQSLQDNEIQIHQRPSVMETEIEPTRPSRNIKQNAISKLTYEQNHPYLMAHQPGPLI